MITNDTIAAISSGLTESGIGIVRISGPESYEIINKIFKTGNGRSIDFSVPNKIYHGFITAASEITQPETENILSDVSRETLDEVLVINMKAPHTYTGENTVEIDCHGGVLMMKRILENVIAAGARPAEPGEFTKRAFLNGKIDLSQAEAVIDIINAKNNNAISASVSQLRGNVSREISGIRAEILNDTAFIESALDDPEHYSLDGFSDVVKKHAEDILFKLNKLISSYGKGKIIKEGINTVIIGKPNAGKSSLLNAILGEERAIVTTIPGTTRDTINESVSLGNITLNIADTAGIRKTDDVVEKIGVERALKSAEEADLILLLADLSKPAEEADEEIIGYINRIISHAESQKGECCDAPIVLTIFNKSDLPAVLDIKSFISELPVENRNYLVLSAKNENGIDELYKYIDELFSEGKIDYNDQLVISSLRHLSLLKEARSSLEEVIKSISDCMPEDMYTIDLMNAYSSLGKILGEEVGEDLINEIFSKFCMGK